MKEKRAKEFSKGNSEQIVHFLNEYPDLPIIAHSADYDHGIVLTKAFKKVGTFEKLPKTSRWRCTQILA